MNPSERPAAATGVAAPAADLLRARGEAGPGRAARWRRLDVAVPLAYAAFSAGWIVFSDLVLAAVTRTVEQQARWATVKGLAFILATTALLHLLLRAALARDRAAHRRVEETESVLRAIADSIPEPVFVKDRESRFIFANPATLAVIGKPASEVIGRKDTEIYADPAVGAALVATDRRIMEAGLAEVVEERIQTPDAYRVYLSTKAPFRSRGGEVLGTVGVARDVTERRAAELALRRSEERLRLLVEHAPAAVAMFDRELRHLAVSRRYLTDLRVDEPDVVGRSLYDVLPEIPARWRAIHQRCLAGAVERCHEDPFPRPDGTVDWLRWEIRPWRDAAGEIGGIVLFSEIVTERKQAEEALHRSETQLQTILESLSEGLIIASLSGELLQWNRAALEMFGYAAPEEAEHRLADLAARYDVAELDGTPLPPERWPLARILRGEHLRDVELRVRRREGDWSRIHAYGGCLVDGPAGEPLLAVATISDLTERRRAEEQFAQAQKLESIGRLAGGVAHDFNNLLTVILSSAEALRAEAGASAPAGPDDVEAIRTAAGRARDLTRQLLAFARRQVIAPVALDLNEVVASGERMLRRLLREDIALTVSPQRGLWPVRCDPAQLEQVILNLAVNARDAMPRGGTLAIETRNAGPEDADARGAGGGPGRWVRLVIRDSGAGLTAEAKAHLFEPFFTTKPRGEGTGLGLATVYGIVKQSGGHIHVESEPGRGTEFTLCFPATQDAATALPPPPEPATTRGSEVILVVEDDALVRGVTVRALRAGGYQVLVAADGREALALDDGQLAEVRLLVSDVVMPGLDGRALADALRRRLPSLRVLFVSGYTQDAIAERGVLETGVEFLPKPFTPASLLARVRTVLDAP